MDALRMGELCAILGQEKERTWKSERCTCPVDTQEASVEAGSLGETRTAVSPRSCGKLIQRPSAPFPPLPVNSSFCNHGVMLNW